MQSIGLVGGMSWESSAEYYKLLNVGVEQRLGGLHSARTVMSSVEFAEITALQDEGRWDDVAELLTVAARGVQAAGADFLLLCTTAFHRVADQVEEAIDIPLLHLGDVVAGAVKANGFKKVALIGTSFSMEHPFFAERFARFGVEVIVPAERHHEAVNRVIYEELVHGKVLNSSRREVLGLVDQLWDDGAQGIILGCTELELLVKPADSELPLFLPTPLHVAAALDRALQVS